MTSRLYIFVFVGGLYHALCEITYVAMPRAITDGTGARRGPAPQPYGSLPSSGDVNGSRCATHTVPQRIAARAPSSEFKQVFAYNHRATEVDAGRFGPHLLGDLRIVRRYEVRKHQCLDARRLCHASGVFC
jgi:hypothetical protein